MTRLRTPDPDNIMLKPGPEDVVKVALNIRIVALSIRIIALNIRIVAPNISRWHLRPASGPLTRTTSCSSPGPWPS